MRKIHAATLIVGALVAGVADSATTTTTFQVTATVQATCSTSATSLAFPAYTPTTGNLASTSTISVRCTRNTSFTVALNKGTTVGASIGQRLMASGANTLQYNLYTSAGFGTVFGDGSGGSQTITQLGLGITNPNAITVFGQLADNATNQLAVPGNYTDTITVTVTY
jgi:spore coat protein U-like protein